MFLFLLFPPVFVYGYESWTITKVEYWRTDASNTNYGVEEDSWESYGLQGDSTSPSYRKSVLNIHGEDWCWSWNSNSLPPWCEELTHLKRPWCWERLKAGEERGNRGWDCWMVSPTRWTQVWASSRNWWWTGKPDMLHSMRSQRVRHNWSTELNRGICVYPSLGGIYVYSIVIKTALYVVFYCSLVVQWFLTLLWPHGPLLARLLCPWDFLGKTTEVGCHFLLQRIFLTQGLNRSLCLSCNAVRLFTAVTAEDKNFILLII